MIKKHGIDDYNISDVKEAKGLLNYVLSKLEFPNAIMDAMQVYNIFSGVNFMN